MWKIDSIDTLINLVIAVGGLLRATIALFTYRGNKLKEDFNERCQSLLDALNKDELSHPYYKKYSLPFIGSIKRSVPTYLVGFIKSAINPIEYEIDKELSLFDNFYYYLQCHTIILEDGQNLSHSQIVEIYNRFFGNLKQRDIIDAAFNETYNTIDEVVSSLRIKKKKIELIRIIQSKLSSKQLILYFINQVQYAGLQRKENKFMIKLKKYRFFERMFDSDEYKGIEKLIPLPMEKLIYPRFGNVISRLIRVLNMA